MTILLTAINSKYIHSNPAVYSLAAYAKHNLSTEEKKKCQIEIAEYTINHRTETILADIFKRRPEVLAFSCYIWNWEYIKEIITELHKLLPEVPIYLGGPEVSYTPEEVLEEFPFLAGILAGEGEGSFLELCRYLSKKEGDGKAFPRIKYSAGLMDMDDLPFFYNDMTAFEHRIIYYESSRGCPYRCSYCLSSIDKTVRLRNTELVKKELQFFLDLKVKQVKFIDRTFNCNHDHACQIWEYILKNDNGVTNFHFEISADILTERELKILEKMRPGLVQLEIGVQSTNPKTIREIHRVMDVEKLRNIVDRIHSFGNIHQHLDLIAGLPYEDMASFQKSFNDVYSMKPEQLQLGFLKVLKGAEMREKAEEYGIVYTGRPPYEVLFTKWITYDEILRLKQIEEMVEMYYNSSQFTYTLSMLLKEFESAFQLYDSLAQYYENEGYALQNPARVYRYRILLDFCKKTVPGKEEMYKELLTFDIYLREKMKTRPDFAKGQDDIKVLSRTIYQREEENGILLPAYKGCSSKQLAKMTQLESFRYSVWEQGNCKKMEEERLVIFDYNERNPLNQEARILILQQEAER